MLVGANLAMLFPGRRKLSGGVHAIGMFTGGDVDMMAGMFLGNWLVQSLKTLRTTTGTSQLSARSPV